MQIANLRKYIGIFEWSLIIEYFIILSNNTIYRKKYTRNINGIYIEKYKVNWII